MRTLLSFRSVLYSLQLVLALILSTVRHDYLLTVINGNMYPIACDKNDDDYTCITILYL